MHARRRDEIIAAAIGVIARDGLSATTIEKVAHAADISPGTITFHFQKKDQLLLAVLDAVTGEFEQARRAAIERVAGDPASALDSLIGTTFDPALSAPDKVAVWYAFWGEASARAIYMARVGRLDDVYHDDLVVLVDRLIRDGGYRGLDAEAVASAFAGLLEWLWQGVLSEGPRFDRKRAIRIARAFLTGVFQRHFPPAD